ncbi:hypothetical protein [Agrobacterium tumefaciens]|uniref:hypothetical protein n=1 Tax=Agrobacterium tumefaciens TaxID=358 RepID=UPI001574CA57|nr:hypothetical protein [Agrobacterium tumefaciens]NTE37646.1 hypothetical protein [Agrobacterium tumefaciens]NTE53158.1 hypothetical protein [Agrobacterium tumefaciens]
MNNYYFWYRQTKPAGGGWVVSGPHTEALAKHLREISKLDGEVGVVFRAASTKEAERMDWFQ